jgi:hypothetical protein
MNPHRDLGGSPSGKSLPLSCRCAHSLEFVPFGDVQPAAAGFPVKRFGPENVHTGQGQEREAENLHAFKEIARTRAGFPDPPVFFSNAPVSELRRLTRGEMFVPHHPGHSSRSRW